MSIMSARVRWVGIIVGLLGTSLLAQLILLAVATSDPAFAIEPDYEQRAREPDAEQRQRSINQTLGWAVTLRTQPAPDGGGIEVRLTAADADGVSVAGASVEVEAFPNARASRVHRAVLIESEDGGYVAHLPARRSGLWEFRIAITRGETRFTTRVRKEVLAGDPRAEIGSMIALIATIFFASLLGSLHCAGMCGAFVALTIGGTEGGRAGHIAAQTAYHGGRLAAYVALGAAAGALGGALDLTGDLFRVQRAAIVLTGIAMIVFGIATFLRIHGRHVPRLQMPAPVRDAVGRGYEAAVRMPPVPRALAIGLLSACLPCGWLYAFAAAAAGTGSVALGATAMAVFWVGTLPVLVSLGAGARVLAGPFRRHVPAATAIALVAVGVMALVGRLDVPALTAPAYADAPLETLTAHVHTLDAHDAPCCQETP